MKFLHIYLTYQILIYGKKTNSVIGMGLEQALHNTRLSPCIENIIGVVNVLIHAKKQIIVKWCIHCKTPKFGYIATATLPICIETLCVQLVVISIIHADTTVYIEGTTNLFDRADFTLSMQKEEQLFC